MYKDGKDLDETYGFRYGANWIELQKKLKHPFDLHSTNTSDGGILAIYGIHRSKDIHHSYSICLTAVGREPFCAHHTEVTVPMKPP